ncbi:hypothetical protein [Methyloceanibacter sp.]|uniref:hypothetical protein n=1 Tax=Methyloceanibacter sp. TaxID=1965321 RepID=UPI003D6CBD23
MALLFAFALAAGLYSVHLGIPQMWDIKNYHIYNPFAALNHRYLFDVAPAQAQSYYNPALDFPFYLLIEWFNDRPRLIAFVLGAGHGLNLLCVALLAWYLLEGVPPALRTVLAGLAVLIGATGAGSMPLIGAVTGDLQAATPILAALVVAIYGIESAQTNPTLALRALAISGMLAGLAVGLKLTMGAFGLGLAASLLVLPRAMLLGGLLRFAGGGIVGFLVAGGPHYFTIWRLFGNPFLPMFNTLFQSPYWQKVAPWDRRFLPKSWFDWLFYPFEWAHDSRPSLVAEFGFRDIRLALAIALGVIVALTWLNSRLTGHPMRRPLSRGLCALIIFALVGYLLWLPLFSIYRYLLPLELLSGIFIVLALGALLTREAWPVVATAVAGLCIATTIPLEWGHAPIRNRYVEISAPTLQPNTLVVIMGTYPISYLVPFFDRSVRWVGGMNGLVNPDQDNLMARRARDLIRGHQGPLMMLEAGAKEANIAKAMARLSLARSAGECAPVSSNLGGESYRLCPVEVQLP